MFFQMPENLRKLGKNSQSLQRTVEGKSEYEVVQHIIGMLNNNYGDDPIISKFLSFLHENRREVFLYLEDRNVEKTAGKAEQHFSVMSWLLKHRFETKMGLLKMSYWHHHHLVLSTRN